jgi:hypothetical protein
MMSNCATAICKTWTGKRNKATEKPNGVGAGVQLSLDRSPFCVLSSSPSLAVIYIYNGHNADKTIRNINRVSKELKELQYEYKTLKSEVMFRSKQTELAKTVAPFGLKLMKPPVVLNDSVTKNKTFVH